MKITLETYESFFLDYHEGSLSEKERREVLLFVQAHPQFKEEFESFELITLEPKSDSHFKGKSALKKKEISLNNYSDFMIASLEGDLSSSEIEELNTFIKNNPALQNEFLVFGKAKFVPEQEIMLKNKGALKKNTGVFRLTNYQYYAAAASVVLLIGIYLLMKSLSSKDIQPGSPGISQSKRESSVPVHTEAVPETKILPAQKNLPHPDKKRHFVPKQIPVILPQPVPREEFAQLEKISSSKKQELIPVPAQLLPDTLKVNGGLLFAAIPEEENAPEETPVRLAGAFGQLVKKNFNHIFGTKSSKATEQEEEEKTDLWKVAHFGTQAIAAITGKEIILDTEVSPNTNVTRVSIASGDLEFTRTTEK